MPDSSNPASESFCTPIDGTLEISISEKQVAESGRGPVIFEETFDLLEEALTEASGARLHLAAVVEVLQRAAPNHLIEAHLYLGNLGSILEHVTHLRDVLAEVCGTDA